MTKNTHYPFDTLAYSNKLKQAGMDAKLAEVQAEMNSQIFGTIIEDQTVTKKDLFNFREENKANINDLRHEAKSDIISVEKRLIDKISESSWRVIFILGSMQAIVLGVLSYAKN